MTVSSLARRSSFCHFWTLLKNRCRRRAFCGWIGATHQCQFKKEVAEPSKIEMFMPSNHWSFCHLAKRSLHASPRHFQEIMLTSERYGVQRLPFAQVSSSDISFFEQLMPGRVITDTDELNFFNVDWLKSVRGCSKVLLKPQTTQEVSEVLRNPGLPGWLHFRKPQPVSGATGFHHAS